MDLVKIDKKISELAKKIDFYPLLTPINQTEERENFFIYLKKGEPYNPIFRYKEKNMQDEKRALHQMRSSLGENDNIQKIFARKIDFMLTQLDLLQSDDAHFSDIAAKLHGLSDKKCLKLAREILQKGKDANYIFPEETLSPNQMASILQKELDDKGIDWKCALSSKIIPKVTISGKDKTVYINSNIDYTTNEVERLKVHEIKVHIYRGANGDIQPFVIFREGLAGYNETEEGLAIIAEEILGCHKIDTRQMKLYAGRALCADYCMKGAFHEVFVKLTEFFPDYMAYRLAERGKRGMKDTSCKGGLTKGYHYISGREKVRKYVEEGGDLSILYVGKIGLEDVSVVRKLLEEGILKEPKYLPEFIT